MDQASEGKAIALQLQDVQALLDQENANDEEGEISDQRIAMQTYQENLMQHLTFLGDARMARSFANAVQSDDQLLADACEDENVAANDQLLAQRLAGGPAASYPKIDLDDAEPSNLAQFNRTEPVLSSSPTTATSVDKARDVGENRGTKRERELSVVEDHEGRSKRPKVEILNTLPVLSSKRKRSPSPHGQVEASSLATSVVMSLGNGEEAQNSVTSNKRVRTSTLDERVNEEQIACISCGEPDPGTHLSLENCKHCYCKECVISWVEAALDPGSTFPPVCCNHQITLEVVEPYISLDLARRFKMQEKISLAAACPLICAEPGCLVGISTQNIVGDKGHCLACKRNTCNKCRMGWHEDEECVADEERALIMGMAKKEGWQSCFRCGNLVELNTGCYHMICLCKASFCYLCGLKWHECLDKCAFWDEERLLAHTNRVTDRRAVNRTRLGQPPDARPRAVQLEEVRALVQQDCDHGQWEYLFESVVRAEGLGNCRLCDYYGDKFLLRCHHCRIMSCRWCSRLAPPRTVHPPRTRL